MSVFGYLRKDTLRNPTCPAKQKTVGEGPVRPSKILATITRSWTGWPIRLTDGCPLRWTLPVVSPRAPSPVQDSAARVGSFDFVSGPQSSGAIVTLSPSSASVTGSWQASREPGVR